MEKCMKPIILAIATALPQYSLDQSAIAQNIAQAFQLSSELKEKFIKLYEKTAIKRRFSVLEDIEQPVGSWQFWGDQFPEEVPGTQDRNEVYMEEAPKLAIKAAQAALTEWGENKDTITHVISVSCTGVMAPGIEFILQQELGLKPTVQRLGINFMGCFGAFRGLAVAAAIASQDPVHRILLVCTELCSLHMQISFDPEVMIGNALFADGAGAAIIGSISTEKPSMTREKALWTIEKSASYGLPDSQDKMTWVASDNGFVMKLSRDVPQYIESCVSDFAHSLLQDIPFGNCTWAIHPGGKKIIEVIEKECSLSKGQTSVSWEVLSKYGNMSSATFLFLLEKLKKQSETHILGLGFGPGLSIEGILLKKYEAANR